MRSDIKIPHAGESVNSCQLAKWHKEDSSLVKRGDIIITLETDKVSQEIEATYSGTLSHQVSEGTTAEIGEVIGYIEHDGSEVNHVIEEQLEAYKEETKRSFTQEALSIVKYGLMVLGVLYLIDIFLSN